MASSEGSNNVELARLYEDTCPFRTAPQKQDIRIRQGIDGFPMVVFWYDGENTSFIGKYNFNFDKATPEVFGFAEGDESWEILNNTSDRVLWKDDDYSGTDWQGDFEARYPKDYADPANLSELAAWLKSTDPPCGKTAGRTNAEQQKAGMFRITSLAPTVPALPAESAVTSVAKTIAGSAPGTRMAAMTQYGGAHSPENAPVPA